MRIIAGTARSLPLKTLPGMDTRPTGDRAKETLFNMIQDKILGAAFLDLFAGSGGIGLEALSRGAEEVIFVDNDKKAADCIKENIRFTKMEKGSQLLCRDALTAMKLLEGRKVFHIIFLDPPYDKGLEREVLTYLSGSSLADEETLIIVEASRKTDFSYLARLGYERVKQKEYKKNLHLFLQKSERGRSGNEESDLSGQL